MMILITLLLPLLLLTASSLMTECPAPSPCRCGHRNSSFLYIYCSKQSWKSVPIFKTGYEHLVYDELILSSNNIHEIRADSFSEHGRISVVKLDLSNNPVRQLHPKSFSPLARHLKDLRISSDPQSNSDFDCRCLDGLSNLTSLSLSSFKIDGRCTFPVQLTTLVLYKCVFSADLGNLVNLEELAIEYSDLSLINFPEFPNLQKLSLSGNGLKTIDGQRLSPAPKLHTLDLSINQFSGLFPLLEHLTSLKTLIAKHNELTASSVRSLFEKHCCMRNLSELNLDRNLVRGSVDNLYLPVNLKKLSIRSNKLSKIGNNALFLPPLLETLDLAGNPLAKTTLIRNPDAGSVFPRLNYLDLSRVHSLKNAQLDIFLDHLTENLQTLIMSNMSLDSLPANTRFFHQLRTLDLSNNPITHFNNLPDGIQTLLANNMSLTSVPNVLTHLTKLELLSLNSNPIKHPLDLTQFPSLQTLLIDQYHCCDCSSSALYDWLKTHEQSSVICLQPITTRNAEFADLDQFQCEPPPVPRQSGFHHAKPTIINLQVDHSSGRRVLVNWNGSVVRVTLRRLPFGPLISSPATLANRTRYEFADNSTTRYHSKKVTYQVCLNVRRRTTDDLVWLDKYCKNFAVTPALPHKTLSIVLVSVTSLALMVLTTFGLLVLCLRRMWCRSSSSSKKRQICECRMAAREDTELTSATANSLPITPSCCHQGTAGSHLYQEIRPGAAMCDWYEEEEDDEDDDVPNITPFDSLTHSSAGTDHGCRCHHNLACCQPRTRDFCHSACRSHLPV